MSHILFEQLLLPLIIKIIKKMGIQPPWGHSVSRPSQDFEDFVLQQLSRELGILGEIGGECRQLKYRLEEMDDIEVEKLLEKILNLWINLSATGVLQRLFEDDDSRKEGDEEWKGFNPFVIKRNEKKKIKREMHEVV